MSSRTVSKTYGTVSSDRQREMNGLEFVRGLVDGTLPLNTIAETLGYDVTEAVRGRVVVTAKPNDTHLNPFGTVHVGLAAALLDSCMGLAVLSSLEKGVSQTTLEFKISLMRPISRPNQSRGHRLKLWPAYRDSRRASYRLPGTVACPWYNDLHDLSELDCRGSSLLMRQDCERANISWG